MSKLLVLACLVASRREFLQLRVSGSESAFLDLAKLASTSESRKSAEAPVLAAIWKEPAYLHASTASSPIDGALIRRLLHTTTNRRASPWLDWGFLAAAAVAGMSRVRSIGRRWSHASTGTGVDLPANQEYSAIAKRLAMLAVLGRRIRDPSAAPALRGHVVTKE